MAKTAKKAAKPTPAPELEEVEDDDVELEEVEEDDEVEEAPAKKGAKKAAAKSSSTQEVTFGASDLAKYITEKTGKAVDARQIRTLIRRMARDGSGRIKREIVAGNRTRYDWSGPNDPEVKAIVKAFNAGELEQDKKEKLDALKAKKAEEKAAGDKSGKKSGKKAAGKKAAKPAPVEDDDEELELDDDDEDE